METESKHQNSTILTHIKFKQKQKQNIPEDLFDFLHWVAYLILALAIVKPLLCIDTKHSLL